MALSTSAVEFDAGSYRDRDARVFCDAQGLGRVLSARALEEWNAVSAAGFFQQATAARRIIGADLAETSAPELDVGDSSWAGVLRHERVPCVSFPFEWSFGMLRDAALLQLELLADALDDGFTLKDGTAYNVQWMGARPVFIDVASFERLTPGQPWAGYRQFCQTMLFPLLLQSLRNVAFQPWLRGALEGISAGDCARLLGWHALVKPWLFTHVWLHARLEGWTAAGNHDVASQLPASGFNAEMVRRNALSLAKQIRRLKWAAPARGWSLYTDNNTYTPAAAERKREFVRAALGSQRWGLVCDLGANTGNFSRLAAEFADNVVALDADQGAIETLYQSLKADPPAGGSGNILPLIVNLTDPSPGLGWRGRERQPLFERARPDLLLCLALVHHLVFGSGIPLPELLEWLAQFRSALVIEFVDRADPMVARLLRGRRDNYADYSRDAFVQALAEHFELLDSLSLEGGTRWLYFARPRA
ncbi:MAG: methyltransferase [Planctomycetaceae bacterium]